MVIRLRILIIFLFIAYGTLLFHLYTLQIVKGKTFLARAESQYLASGFINSKRGVLYFTDKDNNLFPAALNKDFPLIYAVPKLIEDPEETAQALSELIGKPAAELKKSISNKKEVYKVLVRKADSELV